jgi:hypothetical protein
MDKKLEGPPQYIAEYRNKAWRILDETKELYTKGPVVYDFTKLDLDSLTTFNILIALKNVIWETEERCNSIIYVNDEVLEKFCKNIPDFFDKLNVRYKE